MREVNYYFILVLIAVLVAGCNEQKVQSHWLNQGLHRDSDPPDWTQIQPIYSEGLEGSISACNNAEYLYLRLQTREFQILRSAARSGLTLWFDHSGKKGKYNGFNYKSLEADLLLRGMGENTKAPASFPPGRPGDYREPQRPELILFYNSDQPDDFTRRDGSKALQAAFSSDSGVYAFEFAIPLALSPNHAWAIGAHAGETIGVGIQVGGRGKRPSMGEPKGFGGGMGPPPGGGGPGMPGGQGGMGGPGRGGSRPGGGNRNFPNEKRIEIWMKVKLAESLQDTL